MTTLQTFTIPVSQPNTEDSQTRLYNETALDGTPVPHRELLTGFDRDGSSALMVVNGSMPYIVHGHSSPSSAPHTLLILTFHMLNRQLGKRFRAVRISLTFDAHGPRGDAEPLARSHRARGGRPEHWDPEVVALAPHGTALYQRTAHTVSSSHALELGLEIGVPGLGNVGPKYSFTRADSGAERVDAVRVVGDRFSGPGQRSRANGVRWDLFENEATKGGVPSFLRTAVLLRRQPGDNGQFLGTVKVETDVSGLGGVKESWWRMVGAIPRDEPLVFDPRREDRPGEYKRYKERLGELDLESVAAVVSDEEGDKVKRHAK